MKTRQLNHASAMVGMKGTGKSTDLAQIARAVGKNSKVLVMDVNGSPAYAGFKAIEAKDIKRWKGNGIAKIIGTPSKETLLVTAADFRDGLVIFEDSTKYIKGNVPPDILNFLVDHRMFRCDLIFTFHAIKRIPPQFWEMISYVVLKKTMETFDAGTYKNKVPCFEKMLEAFEKVKAHKDPYYSITVETMI